MASTTSLVGLQKTVEQILSKYMKRSSPIVSIVKNNFKRSMYVLWEGAGGFQVPKSCNKSETLLKSNGCQTVRHICSINVNNNLSLSLSVNQIMMIRIQLVFRREEIIIS